MLTDIEIAQSIQPKNIKEIARNAGIDEKYLEQYGNYKAKVDLSIMKDLKKEHSKLILVTAITPTPAGEGKTTTTIGLADGLKKIGKNVMVALREPSLGPVFGIKGGAAGGGYAQVVPMEDINLHFTGDFHAIGAANNLLAAMLDNHIYQGNELGIDLTIHMDPVDIKNPQTNELKEKILHIVKDISPDLSIHDFRVVYGETHTNLVFDVAMPIKFSCTKKELRELIISEIKKIDENYFAIIQIDQLYNRNEQ